MTRADRQLAKAVNFGLLYGMGADGLVAYARANYGLVLTETEAADYRRAFFDAYPGLTQWHRSAGGRRPTDPVTLGRAAAVGGRAVHREAQ